ncbi:uncharacterized protein LOC130647334 [Hydractinia symbiolongicarpus]|uniref:uncharacterized protein LOC130647334 n=1 Tax=Hydractinia symbiolongicarpus TaxID=13093 RepID=UPI00254B925A|nr:uncharacterized protein LOC130647334 [Hydractinia symbiolongicarpus]
MEEQTSSMIFSSEVNVFKHLIYICNQLIWVSGVALIIVGCILIDNGDQLSNNLCVSLIVVGFITLLVSCFGCYVGFRGHYSMILAFSCLLGIMVIIELVVGAVAFAHNIKNNMAIVGGVAISVALLQVSGIAYACCLMKSIKNEYEIL